MRNAYVLLTALLLAMSELALSNDTPEVLADNQRLSALHDEDQADRILWRKKEISSKTLVERDESRRREVKQMLATARVRTAHDFFCAALIFHHGQTVDDYRLAISLAWLSTSIDPETKDYAYLSASTWDRFMMSQGKPQWYGTKCRHDTKQPGKDELYPVDETAVTDIDRARFDLKPLQTMREHIGEPIRVSGGSNTC